MDIANMASAGAAGAMNAVMSRAYIRAHHPKSGALLTTLNCAFNPNQITIGQTAQWQPTSVPRANVTAQPQFLATQPRSLSLELFFDRSTPRAAQLMTSMTLDPSVEGDIEELMAMTRPVKGSNPPNPPRVTFGWGQMTTFEGYIKSVSATYLLFGRQGYPYRAKAQVQFGQIQEPTPGQNPTSGSERTRNTHRVAPGDTLHSIAQAEYSNPRLWRGLAEMNDIDDPMRLRVGSELLLPEEDELVGLS